MSGWQGFWHRVLSVETARFVLAMLALNFAAAAVFMLMSGYARVEEDKEAIVNFALGQLFALSMVSFNRYFGRGGDEAAIGKPGDPAIPPSTARRAPIPTPAFGQVDSPEGEQ
jgi:hypothetical protein